MDRSQLTSCKKTTPHRRASLVRSMDIRAQIIRIMEHGEFDETGA